MFRKRGQSGLFVTLVWALIIIAIVLAITVGFSDTPASSAFLDSLPGFMADFYDVVVQIARPLVEGLYFIVTNDSESENVRMIGFAIFLLLSLVGYKSLREFFGGGTSLLVSMIVGIIAGRSLTATILEETALAASPIAAVSLILGFLPILALTFNIDKLGLTQYTKLVVYGIVALVYAIIFTFVFDAGRLGAVYGVGIALLAVSQVMMPYFKKTRQQRQNQSLGRYMAGVEQTIKTAQQMQQGSGNP